jgi:Transglycosylase SLT domain
VTINELIEKHSLRAGVDPKEMKRRVQIESSGNPNASTGRYKGLFQLSDQEFRNHGGTGSIFDPEQNIMAGVNKAAQDNREFKERYGRDPKPIDSYMIHQQGAAGYNAHMANPNGVAWQNIAPYYSSPEIAKKAIWGNLPASDKARLGSVDNVTSKDFVTAWAQRVEGGTPDFSEEATTRAKAFTKLAGKSEEDAKASFLTGEDTDRPGKIPNFFSDIEEPRIPGIQVPQGLTPRFSIG